jgi:hypothetical protein
VSLKTVITAGATAGFVGALLFWLGFEIGCGAGSANNKPMEQDPKTCTKEFEEYRSDILSCENRSVKMAEIIAKYATHQSVTEADVKLAFDKKTKP